MIFGCFSINFRFSYISINYYCSSGALTGQTPAHVPHPIQADSSITNFPSPCDMHPTGHSAAHAPHPIHASVILYAIYVTTFHFVSLYFTINNYNIKLEITPHRVNNIQCRLCIKFLNYCCSVFLSSFCSFSSSSSSFLFSSSSLPITSLLALFITVISDALYFL